MGSDIRNDADDILDRWDYCAKPAALEGHESEDHKNLESLGAVEHIGMVGNVRMDSDFISQLQSKVMELKDRR